MKTEQGITGFTASLSTAGRFIVYPVFHPAAAIYDRTKRDALEADFAALGERLKHPRIGAHSLYEAHLFLCVRYRMAAVFSRNNEGPVWGLSASKGQCMANRYDFDPKTYLQQGAWADVKLGLHRTEELLERLGNPQDSLKIVHVAGTNGKGSTSAFIAGILQAAGYTTGLFTSPYILRFNERIQIDRVDISDEDLLEVAADVRDQALLMDEAPTAFELLRRRPCIISLKSAAMSWCSKWDLGKA
ncbi:MAG: hypothetical protein ACLT98_02700 [Eggerthellaceae bacterium]